MDFARSAKYILSAAIILSGIILGSCTAEEPGDMVLASAEPTAQQSGYKVSFVANGQEIKTEKLSTGEFPSVPEVADIEGARFVGWEDQKGRKAQPADTPVTWDCEYTAVFMPLLDVEGPYIFTGSGGLLRPDAVLDSTELVTALNALASDAARRLFPDLSMAEDDVTVDELRKVLSAFYTSEEMDKVILGFDEAEKLSRSEFVMIMNTLTGRNAEARVIPVGDNYRIPDVSPNRQDYDALMEASIAHEHSESGAIWRKTELQPIYEEGYVLVEGNLYCADSEGFFTSDTVLGSLTFGYDGRYTSGDAVLDGYVSAVIADLAEVNAYSSPSDLLSAVYDYCCESFGFTRRNIYEVGARGWEMSEAVTMFESKSGNSCSYAGAFWALARGLGFEAVAVNGAIGSDKESHAWVEIEIDGKTYIFDPAAEAGVLEGIEAGKDMFMISEQRAAALKYFRG